MTTSLQALQVDAWRGDLLESTHTVLVASWGTAASSTPRGRVPAPWTCLRSAAKPFQLLALLLVDPEAAAQFEPADLAVMAASHEGTPEHAARVEDLLRRAGLGPEHLQCGTHRPGFLRRRPPEHPDGARRYGPLHHNCSGNHTAMLLLARALEVELGTYLDPDTPSQQRIHQLLGALAGVRPRVLVDDCSGPAYGLPLDAMARLYGFLASPARVADVPAVRRRLLEMQAPVEVWVAQLERIGAALATEPAWASGEESAATRLARTDGDRWVVKHGAEGVLGVADRHGDAAWVLKVVDGNARALFPALLPYLVQQGRLAADSLTSLQQDVAPVLRGYRGQVVGELRLRDARDPRPAAQGWPPAGECGYHDRVPGG